MFQWVTVTLIVPSILVLFVPAEFAFTVMV